MIILLLHNRYFINQDLRLSLPRAGVAGQDGVEDEVLPHEGLAGGHGEGGGLGGEDDPGSVAHVLVAGQ